MVKTYGMKTLARALIFGAALLACVVGTVSAENPGRTALFDMRTLTGADPYDIAALEDLCRGGASSGKGRQAADLSVPAAGYALSRALRLSGRSAEAREVLEKAEAALRAARGSDAVRATLAAHLYLELIVDGPSWTRFNASLESAMDAMEKNGAPREDIVYVEAKRLALFPPEIGGDLGRSLRLFASIETGSPLFEFTARYGHAMIVAGDREGARALLQKRAPIDRADAAAAALLDRLRVEDAGATVRAVILPENLRTAEDRIEAAIRLKAGTPLSAETVKEDLSRIAEIPGIATADVRYRYDEAVNEAEVEYVADEEKSRSLAFFTSGTLHAGPHASSYLYPDESKINAAFVYADSNLFGRAWNLALISGVVYNKVELAKDGFAGTPFDVSVEAETLLVSTEELFFYDEHRYLVEESALTSRYLRFGASFGFPLPFGIRLSTSFGLRKDWYTREEDTPDSFVLPSGLLHTARVGLELDMQSRRGPAGLIPVGLRLGAELEYDRHQDSRDWGAPGFWNTEDGGGTLKYGAEVAYGAAFLKRFNAALALGAYGGSNYDTRTYQRLGGSAGPLDSSLRFLRGYRDDEFIAETAWVGHVNAGYELSPGRVHLGAFSDIACLRPALVAASWRTVYSAGLSVTAILPWEIQVYVEYGHGFVDLTGSIDHGHDALSVILIRSFSW